MARAGWIKAWRKLFDPNHAMGGEPVCPRFAWLDLIQRARPRRLDDGRIVGVVRDPRSRLAEDWKWSKSRVNRWLSKLAAEEKPPILIGEAARQAAHQNRAQAAHLPGVIIICNYETYQGRPSRKRPTGNEPERTAKRPTENGVNRKSDHGSDHREDVGVNGDAPGFDGVRGPQTGPQIGPPSLQKKKEEDEEDRLYGKLSLSGRGAPGNVDNSTRGWRAHLMPLLRSLRFIDDDSAASLLEKLRLRGVPLTQVEDALHGLADLRARGQLAAAFGIHAGDSMRVHLLAAKDLNLDHRPLLAAAADHYRRQLERAAGPDPLRAVGETLRRVGLVAEGGA